MKMKGMKKTVSVMVAALLAVSMLGLFGCGGSSDDAQQAASGSGDEINLVEDGKLSVASDLAFPPFEYQENGVPTGFTIDVMQAVCDRMGIELNYTDPMQFDTLLTAVSTNQIDAAAASITITPEREEIVDFSDPYLDSNQSIVVLASSGIASRSDIASGMIVGVQSGTSGEAWANENLANNGVTVQNFDDVTTAFTALEAGKIDAIVNDLPVDQWMVKNSYTDCTIIEEIPTGEQYGIAISKDNPALTAAINEALAEIRADGTYDEIYAKWFGAES